jgi:sugar phosphate permease
VVAADSLDPDRFNVLEAWQDRPAAPIAVLARQLDCGALVPLTESVSPTANDHFSRMLLTSSRFDAAGVRWRILALLVLASFVSYLLRSNLSIAGERMIVDLGLTKVQLGAILAAFAWGYTIFQFPGGIWADRIGSRKAIALMAVGWAITNVAVGFTPSTSVASPMVVIASLMTLRFMMGVLQAPLVVFGATIANWFPVTGWGVPNGWINVGLTFGAAATGPLIAWLVSAVGWRWSFIATAPVGLLLAGIWWWYVRDTPAQHPDMRAVELALIHGRRPLARPRPAPGAWKNVLRNRQVLLLTAGYFCSNYLFYFFFNWLYIYLIESRKLTVLDGGWYAAAPWITGAVGAGIGAYLCDGLSKRVGKRRGMRYIGVVGLTLAAGLMLFAANATSPYSCVVSLSLCLACQQSTESAFWSATTSVAEQDAATACGVLNTGGNLVGGIGALLVPFMVDSLGWPAALVATSVFALVGAGLWFVVDAEARDTASVERQLLTNA